MSDVKENYEIFRLLSDDGFNAYCYGCGHYICEHSENPIRIIKGCNAEFVDQCIRLVDAEDD